MCYELGVQAFLKQLKTGAKYDFREVCAWLLFIIQFYDYGYYYSSKSQGLLQHFPLQVDAVSKYIND